AVEANRCIGVDECGRRRTGVWVEGFRKGFWLDKRADRCGDDPIPERCPELRLPSVLSIVRSTPASADDSQNERRMLTSHSWVVYGRKPSDISASGAWNG